jgi:hypothetical protein
VVHIEDIRTLPAYLEGDPSVVKIADIAGARTYFVVPMLKENDLIGTITIYRHAGHLPQSKLNSSLTLPSRQSSRSRTPDC